MTVEDGKGLLSACPGSSSVNGSFEIYFLHTCEAMGSLLAEKSDIQAIGETLAGQRSSADAVRYL